MENSLSDYLLELLKKHWIAVALALGGLVFLIYGLISFVGSEKNTEDIKFETNSSKSADFSQNLIAVDIEGEVAKPGVYKLKENSIVQDALVASGGLTALADRAWIAKNVNLALKVADGQKMYFPKTGENISQTQSTLGISTSNTGGSSLINVNSASEQELDSLPGVGPVTANKIINARPYLTVDDLTNKKVVSKKVFDQIKDKIIAQ